MAIEKGRSFVHLDLDRPTPDEIQLEMIMDFCLMATDRMDEIGMSRKELAGVLGVSPSQVSRVLGGRANITIGTMAEYAAAIGLPLRLTSDQGMIEGPGLTVTATTRKSDQDSKRRYAATEVAHA